MRSIKKVDVNWAILHLVAPGPGNLDISPRELVLDPDITEFLARHIENGLRDGGVRSARFRSTAEGTVAALCRRMISGAAAGRVRDSGVVAALLYEAIGTDQRITPGAFVVVLFLDVDDDQHKPRLGLIKLDPGAAFRTSKRTADTGETYLTLERVSNALPTTRERLQKCAFVELLDEQPAELLVLDRQVSEPSADFFLDGFLDADLVNDDKVLTERLIAALTDAFNEVAESTDPEHAVRFRASEDGLLAGRTADLDSWIDGLDGLDSNIVERHLAANDVERSFDLDPAVLRRKRRLVRYEGDHGLQVAVDPQFQEMIKRYEVDGSDPRQWRIEILTRRWELK